MRHSESGFTVVETLMAMVVAGAAALALSKVLVASRAMADEAVVRDRALRTAEVTLQRLRSDPSAADATAAVSLRQGVVIELRELENSSVHQIRIVVPWQSGRRSGETVLVSYDVSAE